MFRKALCANARHFVSFWSGAVDQEHFGTLTEAESDEFVAIRCFRSQDVLEVTRHPVNALHGQKTKRKAPENLLASRSREML